MPTALAPLHLALLPVRLESLRTHMQTLMQGVVDVANAFGARKSDDYDYYETRLIRMLCILLFYRREQKWKADKLE